MIGGIVEVAEAGRHLSIYRGFLKITADGGTLGQVPLDDITALILSGPQITLSKHVMVALAERRAVVIVCGQNWHPLSFTLPFGVHFEAAGVLRDQINAGEPLKKRLWQRLVRAKIGNQAVILAKHAPKHDKLSELVVLQRRVKSGDPENMEAQAARHYWPALMAAGFRRDRAALDANSYLNYGYTILRAATARAVCGVGLNPALGLHHGSRVNAFALVDDLMEPFRPLVDIIARDFAEVDDGQMAILDPDKKRRLAAVLQQDLIAEAGASPLINCLGRLAQSLAASLAAKKDQLDLAQIVPAGRLI
jgi:CRISP-associated protein Cas1